MAFRISQCRTCRSRQSGAQSVNPEKGTVGRRRGHVKRRAQRKPRGLWVTHVCSQNAMAEAMKPRAGDLVVLAVTCHP